MEDEGDSKTKIREFFHKKLVGEVFDARDVFQSVWVRYCAISTYIFDRRFMESKLSFILHFGTILWFIFCVSKISG